MLKQQQDELAGQEKFTLRAPVSGTIAAVLIKQGQSVKASEPVMTLIPDNAHLQIELYATSKKAGFIRPGQRVSLKFSAFPYQKFGISTAQFVKSVIRPWLLPTYYQSHPSHGKKTKGIIALLLNLKIHLYLHTEKRTAKTRHDSGRRRQP